MDFKNIKKFIDLAKKEGVSELKYESKEVKISVNLGGQLSQVISHPAVAMSNQPIQTSVVANDKASANDGCHEVTSPFVGTFYGSPSPDKPTYVKVGDRVSKGQTLCILEAMKIMNEIESDVSGEVVEICIENESLVEFGQTLYKIRV